MNSTLPIVYPPPHNSQYHFQTVHNLSCPHYNTITDTYAQARHRKNPKTKSRPHSFPRPLLRAGNSVSVLPNPNPQKNSFGKTESALKPHALPEYLEGRTPKEKPPFLFQKKFHPRQIRNARSVFSFGVAGVLASAWGFLRAYDFGQSHYALRVCETSAILKIGASLVK